MSQRQYEIVLYGASGFTGKLVAEYLIAEQPQLRWAIAGRNQQKLEQVRLELGAPDLPIVIADSNDPSQLGEMARQTRTLISTVGPYAQYGTPVLEACATEGHIIAISPAKPSGWRRCTSASIPLPKPTVHASFTAVVLTLCPLIYQYFSFKDTLKSDSATTPRG